MRTAQYRELCMFVCLSQEIRGFYHQQSGVVPQQLDARLESSAEAAAAPAGSLARRAAQPAAAEEHAVLRPVQLQERTAAGALTDTAATAAAGLRQSRQRQQQQQDKPKQQQQSAQAQQQHQQQSAEALTPRAARLQRRLQLQQQQHPGTENACPAVDAGSTAATGCGVGGGSGKVQGNITAEEFGQLPSWCRSLLSVEVLNGVLQELSGVIPGR